MTRSRVIRWLTLLLLSCFPASIAFAETIEFVTYYPAPGGAEKDLHVDSLSVGDPYTGVVPGNGVGVMSTGLWLGAGYDPLAPPPASERLHIVGNNDVAGNVINVQGGVGVASSAVFMPGAGAGTIQVGIGTANPTQAALEIKGITNAAGNVAAAVSQSTNNAANAPSLALRRFRGTDAAPAVIQNNDLLGTLQFEGYDGAQRRVGAQIGAEIDGVPGAGDLPTRLLFSTTAAGAAAPAERMRITNAGNVGIGTNAPTTALDVSGQIRMRGGNPAAAGGVNPNAAATQPIFTDANGVASRGWPSGGMIQIVAANGGNSTVTSRTWTAAGTAIVSITPRSTNSRLLVEATFTGASAIYGGNPNGQNSFAFFRLYNVTGGGAAPLGVATQVFAQAENKPYPPYVYYGAAAGVPASLRVLVDPPATGWPLGVARSFRLYHSGAANLNASTVTSNDIVYTVTEIQN